MSASVTVVCVPKLSESLDENTEASGGVVLAISTGSALVGEVESLLVNSGAVVVSTEPGDDVTIEEMISVLNILGMVSEETPERMVMI